MGDEGGGETRNPPPFFRLIALFLRIGAGTRGWLLMDLHFPLVFSLILFLLFLLPLSLQRNQKLVKGNPLVPSVTCQLPLSA